MTGCCACSNVRGKGRDRCPRNECGKAASSQNLYPMLVLYFRAEEGSDLPNEERTYCSERNVGARKHSILGWRKEIHDMRKCGVTYTIKFVSVKQSLVPLGIQPDQKWTLLTRVVGETRWRIQGGRMPRSYPVAIDWLGGGESRSDARSA